MKQKLVQAVASTKASIASTWDRARLMLRTHHREFSSVASVAVTLHAGVAMGVVVWGPHIF